MGKVTIVEARGEGLYSVRLKYDLRALERELSELKRQQSEYFTLLIKAFKTRDTLSREKEEARAGLDAVIQQWTDGLLDKLTEAAPPLIPTEPNDPETGNPWADPDRAQDGPLLQAINSARSNGGVGALARKSALDTTIRRHLVALKGTSRVSHYGIDGSTAEDRARLSGYSFDGAVGIAQLLAYGARAPDAAVAQWLRHSAAVLLGAGFTDVGVYDASAPDNTYGYLWGAVLSAPGTPPPALEGEAKKDPAQEAAQQTEEKLDKIEPPRVETFQPKKLGEVAAKFGIAAAKLKAAEDELTRLYAEKLQRDGRVSDLEKLKAKVEQPFDCWACFPDSAYAPGDTADAAEIPGFWNDEPTPRETTMGIRFDPEFRVPERQVSYYERKINLIPAGLPTGQLRHALTMSGPALFLAVALEPGALRWKPCWRYGTITAKNGDSCDVDLEAETARLLSNEKEMALDGDADLTLADVPIWYPPCNGAVFQIGDEVLLWFDGWTRAKPKVIGFRREPKPCPQGRQSWLDI